MINHLSLIIGGAGWGGVDDDDGSAGGGREKGLEVLARFGAGTLHVAFGVDASAVVGHGLALDLVLFGGGEFVGAEEAVVPGVDHFV